MIEFSFVRQVLEHLVLSSVPAAIGGVLAWIAVKSGSSWWNRNTVKPGPRILFPWRSAVVSMLVFFIPSILLSYAMGPNIISASIGVASASFVLGLVLFLSRLSRSQERADGGALFLPTFRTVMVAAVGLSVPGYMYQGVGAEVLIGVGAEMSQFPLIWAGYGAVAVVSLVIDLALGFLELVTTNLGAGSQ